MVDDENEGEEGIVAARSSHQEILGLEVEVIDGSLGRQLKIEDEELKKGKLGLFKPPR
jgi:hypothetical protein